MKLKRMGRGIGASLAVGLLVACGALPPAVTPGDEALAGRVLFNQSAPPERLTVRLRTAIGENQWSGVMGATAQTNQNGEFSFSGLNPGRYQPYWDDQGQITTEPNVNTAGVAVPDPVQVQQNQDQVPNVQWDIYWPVNPNPAVDGTIQSFPYTFSWAPKPFLPSQAEYQIFVRGYTPTTKTVTDDLWSSAWVTGNSVAWNGRQGAVTNDPTGAQVGPGTYVYQVKYRKQGGEFGGGNFYGQTKWIPFQVQ